ncbi:hypothetical protein INR49_030663 [Caranx melampygus]|nr:hypothetical protein INR49_030663 [Caranx melampygus]
MDLASRDSYIQKLASKVFSQREQEPKKRPFAHLKGKGDTGPPQKKKKKKCKKKNLKEKGTNEKKPKAQQKSSPSAAAQKSPVTAKPKVSQAGSVNGSIAQTPKGVNAPSNFATVDILRKRLHEKIEESRGQGAPKDVLSEAVQAKRAKRKLDRERKKRKRKEFRMKQLAEKSGEEPQLEVKQETPAAAPAENKRNKTAIIFNKVEMVEEIYESEVQKRKKKKQGIKGQLTPLTGRNYKQLLSRVEARKAKLEELREKDEGKAKELEKKMKWTNLLYKAEGIKIKDDEDMLRTSLKKKEKREVQRKKRWNERSENVVDKMQQRQDKRRRNIQRRKQIKTEKKKEKARKKGRVLPEDLK